MLTKLDDMIDHMSSYLFRLQVALYCCNTSFLLVLLTGILIHYDFQMPEPVDTLGFHNYIEALVANEKLCGIIELDVGLELDPDAGTIAETGPNFIMGSSVETATRSGPDPNIL